MGHKRFFWIEVGWLNNQIPQPNGNNKPPKVQPCKKKKKIPLEFYWREFYINAKLDGKHAWIIISTYCSH